MRVYFGFRHCAILHSLRNRFVGIVVATLHVGAGKHCLGGSVAGIARYFVACPEISDGATVGNNQILKPPFIAQNMLEQARVATTWVVVPALVGAHHLPHVGILYQRFEGWHICFPKIAWRNIGDIISMASPFRSAMDGIVLGASP